MRAKYGKQIFSTLSRKLVEKYGKSFERENLYRMAQFAELFPETKIVSPLAAHLSWSHFSELIRLDTEKARLYYAQVAVTRHLGVRDLRNQISRKAYERQEIANTQLTEKSTVPFNVFKDPYLLDTLGLKENFLEADLEKAILTELELLELDKAGIVVADYWTNLPPKALLEEKIKAILSEAQERLERRKLLSGGKTQKQIEYFFESKD